MREEGAAFAGEVSGHYYFRDFYSADTGTCRRSWCWSSSRRTGRPLAELLARYATEYFISGEINSAVADVARRCRRSRRRYADAEVTHLDGVSVDFDDWHFNVRPSNTEPLLRLNLESLMSEDMAAKRDEVLGLIRN